VAWEIGTDLALILDVLEKSAKLDRQGGWFRFFARLSGADYPQFYRRHWLDRAKLEELSGD